MTTNSQPTQAQRLADIQERRAQLDRQIRRKERNMKKTYNALFAPTSRPKGRVSFLVSNAGTVAAIADGALLGFRILRKIRKIF